MSTIRVAIAGVGNCASSLVQGIAYYRGADPGDVVPGLMHVVLGGYHVGDLTPVAAFDVDAAKVGTDLGKAIFAGHNNTIRFAEVGELGVTVQRGPTFDGLGRYYRDVVEESPAQPVDVAEVLRSSGADVLVSYLPVGSESAQRHYAEACLEAKVAFINAIPVFIASDPEWAQRFFEAGVPIVGDDIKSQVGSTIVHRVLTRLFEDRGLALGPHVPAERGRQHGLPQHARARAARIQEDLENPGGDQSDRAHCPPRRRRPHRAVRPRAVAARPQVGVHPDGGSQFRRRPAGARVEAAGLGLARTRPASSSTPSVAPSWPSTAASGDRSSAPRPTS